MDRVLILIAILFLQLSPALGQSESDEERTLTEQDMNAMAPEEAAKLPALQVLVATGVKESKVIALIELALLDLRYFIHKPSGKASSELQTAIRVFQSEIGSEPTGVLLLGEWEVLGKRMAVVHPDPVTPSARLSVVSSTNLVIAKGTWTFDSDRMSNPIQTSRIECRKDAGECTESFAYVDYGQGYDSGFLFVDTDFWTIQRWSSTEVVAEETSARCVAYTMSINLTSKSASKFRRSTGADGCAGVAEKPQTLRLVDGFDVGWEFNRQYRKDSNAAYSSAFKEAASGGLFEGPLN